MKHTTLVLAALAILCPAAKAQLLGPPHAQTPQVSELQELGGGFAAGVSSPLHDVFRVADPGYHVTAFLTTSPALAPVGDRLEASINQFHYPAAPGSSAGSARIVSVVMNGVITTPGRMHPYLIGGIGYYHASSTCGRCTAKWSRPGVNAGVGVQFAVGAAHTFCELRSHYIASLVDPTPDGLNTGTWFVPVSFGVKF